MCGRACVVCPGTGKGPPGLDMSPCLSFSGVWCVSPHLWMSSLYPRSVCCKGYGTPCPVVTGPGRPRCVSLITLVPWPSPSLPHPFGGSPSTVWCPQALTAWTLPPTLATWTHRCQVKLTPGLKPPVPPSRGQEAVASITQTAPY